MRACGASVLTDGSNAFTTEVTHRGTQASNRAVDPDRKGKPELEETVEHKQVSPEE